MSDELAVLIHKAMVLPYEEQLELLNSLTISVQSIGQKNRRKLDFDSYVIPSKRANFADKYVEELRSNDRV